MFPDPNARFPQKNNPGHELHVKLLIDRVRTFGRVKWSSRQDADIEDATLEAVEKCVFRYLPRPIYCEMNCAQFYFVNCRAMNQLMINKFRAQERRNETQLDQKFHDVEVVSDDIARLTCELDFNLIASRTLTTEEIAVLEFRIAKHTGKEIAARLGVCERTVTNRVRAIRNKLTDAMLPNSD